MTCFILSKVSPLGVLSIYIVVASASARVGYEVESKKEEEEVCKSDVDGAEYRCAVGHCCADASCCTYYYELWWFWLIWMMIILMSCCCAYHHRKKRQNLRSRRNRNIMQGAYSAACSYPGPPVDKGTLGFCKLPKYDEIVRIPPSGSPPPPYRSHRNLNTIAAIETNSEGVASMKFMLYSDLTSSVLSLVNSVGFHFGQRYSREPHQSVNPQDFESSNDLSLSESLSSFATVENEINNNAIPLQKKPTHIINCQQSPPQGAAETETDIVHVEQNGPAEEIPCTSSKRSESSPHFSHFLGNGACSDEFLQQRETVLLHHPPTDNEVPKQKVCDSHMEKITRKISAKSARYDTAKPILKAVEDATAYASSDEDADSPLYIEVDENNNDSMQSIHSAFGGPKCSTKKQKGKSGVKNI